MTISPPPSRRHRAPEAAGLKFLSLFAGIGGLDLGLERAGMTCVGQVEIEPFAQAVLTCRWPDVPKWADVRAFNGSECGPVDLVCGGFPCQDISAAGKGAGLSGERSGLWYEMLRIIRAARPAWVLAENVPALRTRGYDAVAAGLEEAGYTVRPLVVGAWAVGAPHKRDRVWIVANATGERRRQGGCEPKHRNDDRPGAAGGGMQVAHAPRRGLRTDGGTLWNAGHADECGEDLADAQRTRPEGHRPDAGQPEVDEPGHGGTRWPAGPGAVQYGWEEPRLVYTKRDGRGIGESRWRTEGGNSTGGTSGSIEGDGLIEFPVGAPVDGLSERLVRFANKCALRAAGNAVVPQVAEVIGRAIIDSYTTALSRATQTAAERGREE